MPSFPPFLKTLAGAVVGLFKSLVKFVQSFLLLPLYLLKRLLDLLMRLLKSGFEELETYEDLDCPKIPPEHARRPDPCLYSQTYLRSLGIAVTWDNPDIRLTTPNGAPVLSGALEVDTDYVVVGTIHNASFDAATGVVVRSYFRAWGIDFDNRTPTEVDAAGEPVQRIVSIEPWGQRTASFKWHTPATPGHYCITIECFHPADKEPGNNVGQENTDVVAVAPNSSARITIPFFNRRLTDDVFWIEADSYRIADDRVEFRLDRLGEPKLRPSDRDDDLVSVAPARDGARRTPVLTERARTLEAMQGSRIRLTPSRRRARRGERYEVFTYTGLDQLLSANDPGEHRLPEGWKVAIRGAERDERGWRLRIANNDTAMLDVELTVGGAQPGERRSVNINAVNGFGQLVGGVTLYVEVD